MVDAVVFALPSLDAAVDDGPQGAGGAPERRPGDGGSGDEGGQYAAVRCDHEFGGCRSGTAGQDSGDTLAVGRDGRDAQVVAGAEFTGDGCGGGVTDVQQRPVADDVESYVGADRPIPGRIAPRRWSSSLWAGRFAVGRRRR